MNLSCHVIYATDPFRIGFFDEKRSDMRIVLNVYYFMKKNAQEVKGQVPEHQPTENSHWKGKRVEEVSKVSKRKVRILGEQKKAEA